MSHVIIALGSNTLQQAHIQWASQALATLLSDIKTSRVIWTPDIKGSGQWYLNRLVAGCTLLSKEQLEQQLKALEQRAGRTRQRINIDLDLMMFDQEKLHLRDWPRPYIQNLLPDIIECKIAANCHL